MINHVSRRFTIVVRITTVILLLGTVHLSGKTLSQTITMAPQKNRLKEIFSVIEKQTGYTVLYSEQLIKGTGLININAEGMALDAFLKEVLTPVALTYRIDGTNIFIKPSADPAGAGHAASEAPQLVSKQQLVTGL